MLPSSIPSTPRPTLPHYPAETRAATTEIGTPPDAPTRYEDLPAELRLLMAEFSMEVNRDTPEVDSGRIFASLNTPLASLHAAPEQAMAAIRALHAMRDLEHMAPALERLRRVPVQYRERCWRAAWNAPVLRRNRGSPMACKVVDRLLAMLPDEPTARLRELERAVVCMALEPPLKAPRTVIELLRLCAPVEPLPARVWKRLLGVVGAMVASVRPNDCPPVPECLNAQQRIDVIAMCDAVLLCSRAGDGPMVLELLERIENSVSLTCRMDVIGRLMLYWPILGQDHLQARRALYDTLLRMPTPDRETALVLLPHHGKQDEAATLLLEKTAELPAPAALRVLMKRRMCFQYTTNATRLLVERCMALAAEARHHPETQGRILRQIALLASRLLVVGSARELMGVLMEQCSPLPALDRLAVLSALEVEGSAKGAWTSLWDAALLEATTAPESATPGYRQRLLDTLLPTMTSVWSGEISLPTILQTLDQLPPEALARSLPRVIGAWNLGRMKCGEAQFDELMRRCAALPFYLRSASLETLVALSLKMPSDCMRRLGGLLAETRRSTLAWSTRYRTA